LLEFYNEEAIAFILLDLIALNININLMVNCLNELWIWFSEQVN